MHADTSPGPEGPRFAADAMLGRLARWLRLIGCDTAYDTRLDDRALAALAVRERRVLLTRDRGLLARRIVRDGFLVAADDPGAQLRQVVAAFGIDVVRERLFTRCTACNGAVMPVAPEAVAGRVPPYVARTQERFFRCAGCDRIYWGGTHVELALAELGRLLGGPA